MNLTEVLQACPSTELATFSEFLRGLSDAPERGDREAWADLFDCVGQAEGLGLVQVERDGRGRMESTVLTEAGTAKVRSLRKTS